MLFCKDLYWTVPSRLEDTHPQAMHGHAPGYPHLTGRNSGQDCWPLVSTAGGWAPAPSFLQRCIIEQLLDQVHVGQQHATAAVALQAKCIQSVPVGKDSRPCSVHPGSSGQMEGPAQARASHTRLPWDGSSSAPQVREGDSRSTAPPPVSVSFVKPVRVVSFARD